MRMRSRYSGAEMSFTRRNFLIGAGSGLSLLVLTACVDETPQPTPSPSPSPTSAVPQPSAFARSAWSTDSFSRGSYSYLPVGATPDHRRSLGMPVDDRLFFAGEATSADNAATVLGARQSAARASIEVANVAADGEKIAVIGAGAAGSEAARLLRLRGYEVVVIEARDRIGGRIHSVSTEGWPITPQLGAWRIREAADAEVLADLAQLGIGSVELATEPLTRSPTDETGATPIGSDAIDSAVAWAGEQQTDVSLEAALDESGAAETAAGAAAGGIDGTELLQAQLDLLASRTGADASDLSGWFGTPPPLEEERLVTGDYSLLVADALDGVESFLSTAVVGVAYGAGGVSLRLGTGESLSVDRAVLTVPLGVLQDNSIEFEPLLPFSHRTAIAGLGMGAVEVVWLRFDEPFWSTDAAAWSVVGTDDDITTWVNLEPATGEPILIGLVGGEAATRLAELDDDALIAAALASLEPFARDTE